MDEATIKNASSDSKLQLLDFFSGDRIPEILQTQVAECGLACIGMILGYHKNRVDLNTLRQHVRLSAKGLNMDGLIQAAAVFHLSSRPLALGLEELGRLQLPCILHWEMNHFVVLSKVGKKKITIHDPARGKRELSLEEAGNCFTGVALELTPTKEFQKQDIRERLKLSDFWQRVQGLKRSLLKILALSICLQIMSLASPFYMQLVVDDAIVSNDLDLLATLALGFGLLGLIGIAITVLRSWLSLYLGSLFGFQVTLNLFRHLLHLPADYFSQRHMGDILSRFGSADPIRSMVTSGAIAVVLDGIMASTTLVLIFIYSPLLSWIAIAGLVLYSLLRIIAFRPFRRLTEEGLVAGAKESSHFMESIRAVQAVKLFGKETTRLAKWQNLFADSMNLGIRIGKMNIGFGTINSILSSIEGILVVYLGARLVINGEFSIGMLYAFMSYRGQFTGAVNNLINQVIALKMLGLHLERLADLALTPTERTFQPVVNLAEKQREQANQKPSIAGRVEVTELAYRYSNSEPWILKNLNLSVERGECVAIAGPSGCGKTTLLKLLLGLYEPIEGEMTVDATPLRQMSLNHYRQNIAAVMQEDHLFSGSIAENIAMFSEDINLDQVQHCAQLACIHQDINAMPMAYNTLVGDMGSSLSGGQNQRVLLARALYHQPKILFLDEATSSLDVKMEQAVNQCISSLQITRIIIAHRPQTIAMADRVIQLGTQAESNK